MNLINQILFPAGFEMREIETNGVTIHARVGGHHGPAVVLLHGFGNTGDMWAPLAAALAPDHTVIVPDLRGLGLSSKPPGGYDKKTQASDLAGVMDALSTPRADLVTHDIGNMVGYTFAAEHPPASTVSCRSTRRCRAWTLGRISRGTRACGNSALAVPIWSAW